METGYAVDGLIADEQVAVRVGDYLHRPLELAVAPAVAANLDQVARKLLGVVDGPDPYQRRAFGAQQDVYRIIPAESHVHGEVGNPAHPQRTEVGEARPEQSIRSCHL